jgi:hypothetical protein
MSSTEGVIKFQLDFTPGPALSAADIAELMRWRDLLYDHQLIGQDAARYGGYGFGNISARLAPYTGAPGHRPFAISGTQTGHLPHLGPEHYAVVTAYMPAENRIIARGPIRPSSESLTHGVLFDLDDSLRYVLHAHSPAIWHAAPALAIPITDPGVPYGSPEMAEEVRRLFRDTDVAARRIFSMGGHEDGIVAFGPSAQAAGDILLAALSASASLT